MEYALNEPKGRGGCFRDRPKVALSYGIVTIGTSWSFFECEEGTPESPGPRFRKFDAEEVIMYGTRCWEASVRKIFGYIIWPLEQMVKQIPSPQKRAKLVH